jgi:hypothetical protein
MVDQKHHMPPPYSFIGSSTVDGDDEDIWDSIIFFRPGWSEMEKAIHFLSQTGYVPVRWKKRYKNILLFHAVG